MSTPGDEAMLAQARATFPPIWVIYNRPADYPDSFVVRVWRGEVPEPEVGLYPTLELARLMVDQDGASIRLPRHHTDDPVIVESWI